MDYRDLHKYQLKMIDWMLANKRCALWAGVGLGKTVTALTAVERLILNKQVLEWQNSYGLQRSPSGIILSICSVR